MRSSVLRTVLSAMIVAYSPFLDVPVSVCNGIFAVMLPKAFHEILEMVLDQCSTVRDMVVVIGQGDETILGVHLCFVDTPNCPLA